MKTKSDRELIKMFNKVLEDYGFIMVDMRLGENGIEYRYNDFTLFEGLRLQVKTNNEGAFISLFYLEDLWFDDRLSVGVMRTYYNEGVAFEFLLEVVIDTIEDFFEGNEYYNE